MNAEWSMPADKTGEDGDPRRVGVEIELQGVPVDSLARLTAATLDGSIDKKSISEYAVEVEGQGEYRIEVDFKLLKEVAREHHLSGREGGIEELAVEVLSSASSLLVPCEIVSPPIEMDALPEPMDALVKAVRDAGGKGTRQSPLYAFGVHFNVDPPALTPAKIHAFLRAFVCLFDWIVWKGSIDLSRRVTPYIQGYPTAYEDLLLASDEVSGWEQLIDDYLEMNATRNRALDMLPLFGSVDEDRVKSVIDDPLLKFRPAFHYRLANSCIDEPGWSIAMPWRHWVMIERLAGNPEALNECCEAYREDRRRMLSGIDNRWREQVEQWLET